MFSVLPLFMITSEANINIRVSEEFTCGCCVNKALSNSNVGSILYSHE